MQRGRCLRCQASSARSPTYSVAGGDAAVWQQAQIQRLRLPDGLHDQQDLTDVWTTERERESLDERLEVLAAAVLAALETHLQDEHVLPEVVSVFENDADRVLGQSGGVGPFELKPQRLLLGRHHFTLLDLQNKKEEEQEAALKIKCMPFISSCCTHISLV